MQFKLILLIIINISIIFASGGYDNGTSTGKGKFQLDLTWNPFNLISFGQSYAVLSYGITSKLDIHSYYSKHKSGFDTWYAGIFYQFYDSERLDLATAVGVRKRVDEDWTHAFFPQLLYSAFISERSYIGGSFVNVSNLSPKKEKYGTAIDIAYFYKLKYKTKLIESISIGVGVFHPTTWKPKQYFLPTYSIDIKFK